MLCHIYRLFWVVVLIVLTLVVAEGDALAYVDPGTGSYLIQIIIAGVLAAIFVIKGFWRSIRERLAGLFSRKKA